MAKIIKPKLSSNIAEQLPEFIQSDYGKFVNFLEAYYEYTEQVNTRNLEKVRDLDYTLDNFVGKLKNELDYIGKNYAYVDQRFLLEHIKDIYLAKGSEASYKLMFKLLFNKEATIKYPGQYLFKPSDGKWKQEISVLVSTTAGNIFDIVGKEVNFVIGNKKYKFLIARVKQTEFDNIKEVFIESQIFTDIPIGTTLQFGTFYGVVEPTITNVSVSFPGKGFKLGQIYEILSENGKGTKLKIVATSPIGEVLKVQIVKYGFGYQTDANTTISPLNSNSSSKVPFLNGSNLEVSDVLESYTDFGYLSKYDYAEQDYVDNTYVGEILREFYTESNDNSNKSDGADLVIRFTLGGKIKYPGFYETNDSFVSDSIFLQDSKYYQIFSYVVSIEEQLKNYKDYIQTYLHPAGMRMFGEYNITNKLSVKASLQFVLNLLKFILVETISTEESKSFDIGKVLSDNFSVNELASLTLYKNLLADLITQTDTTTISTGKVLNDNVTFDDSIFSYYFSYSRTLGDSFAFSENLSYFVSKALSDAYNVNDTTALNLSKNIGTIIQLNNSGALGDEQGRLGILQAGAIGNVISGAEVTEDYVTLDDSMFAMFKEAWTLFEDTINTSDLSFRNISKTLSESLNISESLNTFLSKMLQDTFTQIDSTSYTFNKVLGTLGSGSIPQIGSLGDINSRLGAMRLGSDGITQDSDLGDSITLDDSAFEIFRVALISLADTLGLTDSNSFNMNKNIAEVVTPTDVLGEFAFSKFLSDIVNQSESYNFVTTKYINNDVATVDDVDNILNVTYNSSTSNWDIYFGPLISVFNSTAQLGSNNARLGQLQPGTI